MSFIKNYSVSDPRLNAAPEHVLVEAIQNERREGVLQYSIRGSVNTHDSWAPLAQEARALSSTVKEAVIRQLLQAR